MATFVVGGRYGCILGRADTLEAAEALFSNVVGYPHTPVRIEQTPPGPWRAVFKDANGQESVAVYGPVEALKSRYSGRKVEVIHDPKREGRFGGAGKGQRKEAGRSVPLEETGTETPAAG